MGMSFRDQLRRLLDEEHLTEWQLAERLGLHRGSIVSMLANDRKPDALQCLLIAGHRSGSSDQSYWLELSGISSRQSHLLSRAVGNPELDLTSFPPEIGADVATFLDFIVHAHPERRKAIQAILRAWQAER
jgi:hypothetical protein